MGSKICSKCKLVKTFDFFTKTKRTKDGYYNNCKECRHLAYISDRDKIKSRAMLWNRNNKERKKLYDRDRRHKKAAIIKIKKKEYFEKNRKRIYQYIINRNNTNILCKLQKALRGRINRVLKGKTKSRSSVKDLGCSVSDLKLHLESKFYPGMTWENYGLYGWHIDHIVPLSSFNLEEREQFLKACHYTNLQPLWAIDNLKKSNKPNF